MMLCEMEMKTSKKEADEVFLINQKKLNHLDDASFFIKYLRFTIINAYYLSVKLFGHSRYKSNKNLAHKDKYLNRRKYEEPIFNKPYGGKHSWL